MAIVPPLKDAYQLEMGVGDASSFFEKTRLWKERLFPLVVNACKTVRGVRANDEHHPGDLLYSALVHCIVQIVEVVVRQNKTLRSDAKIDLRFPMRATGAWKPDAQLQTVLDLSIEVLRVYKDVNFARADLVLDILEDFEVIWLEVLDPMLDTRTELCRFFRDGGTLRKNLLGPELYERMSGIRSRLRRDRGQQAEENMGGSYDIVIAMGS
ncbi:hypothetical protein Q7P37_009859 [Cladosporium fusiforme]